MGNIFEKSAMLFFLSKVKAYDLRELSLQDISEFRHRSLGGGGGDLSTMLQRGRRLEPEALKFRHRSLGGGGQACARERAE